MSARALLRCLLAAALAGGAAAAARAADLPAVAPYNGQPVANYAGLPLPVGLRVVWDGERLRGQDGEALSPPAWFVEGFPTQALEGALAGAPPEALARISRQSQAEAGWRKLRFVAVDMPDATGVFDERRQALRALAQALNLPRLQTAAWRRFDGRADFAEALDDMFAARGDGFLLRHKTAAYGKESDLLALPYQTGEAVVEAHRPGKGQFTGMMGAAEVSAKTFGGFVIASGFSLAQRRKPPKVGARIAFRYRGLTENGKPKNPVFMRQLPVVPPKIGGVLPPSYLTWIFISVMLVLALMDAASHRRGGRRWNLKSAIVSCGLLGTFVGIWWGLYNFDSSNIAASIPALLDGLKFSFVTSIVGMALSTVLSVAQTLLAGGRREQ